MQARYDLADGETPDDAADIAEKIRQKVSQKTTDSFYLPVWMVENLRGLAERDVSEFESKGEVVEHALYDFFEERGLVPEEVVRDE
ncbi:MAG: hypothetical protein SVS85_02040 [Candidatus Nanohaloarchaea archaeon]|nr:hypothetical protein [Candidatus Nanohaloarchaea archaeon]